MKALLAVLVFSVVAAAQTPAVSSGGVLNAASFDRAMPVTPGALISIFGSNLAATTATADSIPLSTVLGGVNVKVNGVDAPLTGVFPSANGDQINAQLPWNVQPGSAQVVVTRNGVASAPQSFQIGQFSPGIFTAQFGVGQAIAINYPDGSLAAPAGSIPGLATRPARAGDTIIILATGLGPVTPAPTSGAASGDAVRSTMTMPTVLIGGVSAPVDFSGLSPDFVGVNQLNVRVPPGLTPGVVSLQISMGGMTTSNQVTIAVQ